METTRPLTCKVRRCKIISSFSPHPQEIVPRTFNKLKWMAVLLPWLNSRGILKQLLVVQDKESTPKTWTTLAFINNCKYKLRTTTILPFRVAYLTASMPRPPQIPIRDLANPLISTSIGKTSRSDQSNNNSSPMQWFIHTQMLLGIAHQYNIQRMHFSSQK